MFGWYENLNIIQNKWLNKFDNLYKSCSNHCTSKYSRTHFSNIDICKRHSQSHTEPNSTSYYHKWPNVQLIIIQISESQKHQQLSHKFFPFYKESLRYWNDCVKEIELIVTLSQGNLTHVHIIGDLNLLISMYYWWLNPLLYRELLSTLKKIYVFEIPCC